jgi:hypothetical protein
MATNPQFPQAIVQAMGQAFLDAQDAGTAAVIEIYDGAQPTDADTAIGAQTKLAVLTCSATSGVLSDGTPGALLTYNAIADDSSADATGTAAWFQILTQSGGTIIIMGSVGTSDADLVFNTVAFTAGSTISITALTGTFPEG